MLSRRTWKFLIRMSALVYTLPWTAHALPPAPEHYVLDEVQWFSEPRAHALSSILLEHDHSTGEQIMVAVLKSRDGQDADKLTHEIFESWQIGKRGRETGALVAVYADDSTVRIEAGYGLQNLDESTIDRVIRKFIEPELAAKHPYRAVGLGVLELLRALQSPLILSGRAEELILQGGLEGALKPTQVTHYGKQMAVFLAIGLLLLVGVLYHVLAAEAHFTGSGWFKPKPSLLKIKRGEVTSGLGGTDGAW